MKKRILKLILIALLCSFGNKVEAYDIIFSSSPRTGGDNLRSKVPDAANPSKIEPSTDLLLLKSGSSVPEILVSANSKGAVIDPTVSYDGKEVYYSFISDLSPNGVNKSRQNLPLGGCNIEKINLQTKERTVLVDQTVFSPATSLVQWSKNLIYADPVGTTYLGYGLCHMSPLPLPNGDLFFVSNKNGYDIIRGYTELSLQGFILSKQTNKISQVWVPPTTILHPIILSSTGEICFSTLENEQFGKPHRWGIWCMKPSGEDWRPLFSATMEASHTRHFITEYKNELYSASYYIENNNGLGTIIKRPLFFSSTFSLPEFGSPSAKLNPKIKMGNQFTQFAYTPIGTQNVLPFLHQFDRSADKDSQGQFYGKAGFPFAAPNGILISYSSGPATYVPRPTNIPSPQLGIYLIPDGIIPDHPNDLVKIYDDPNRNEFFARALVPYKEVYNVNSPPILPSSPKNNGLLHPSLPIGTPFALVGSSSVWRRESCGGQFSPTWECSKKVYSINDFADSNRFWQGVDTHKFQNHEIDGIEILLQEGTSNLSYGPGSSGKIQTRNFVAHGGNQRYKILGKIPLYKYDANQIRLEDKEGNPDTSFLAKIPCDRSFGFRLVNENGIALTQLATWHQAACGSINTSCTGCHTHNKLPLHFKDVLAGQNAFVPFDLTANQLESYEYNRDIYPLIKRECLNCHNSARAEGNVNFQDATLDDKLPKHFRLLFDDQRGLLAGRNHVDVYFGQASKYISHFASAESLLAWVIYGKRLDNVSNSYRPSQLSPGITKAQLDLDFTTELKDTHKSINLTEEEKKKFVRWIDLGLPFDIDSLRGFLVDENKPILTHGIRGNYHVIGFFDPESGINISSLEVRVNGKKILPNKVDENRVSIAKVLGALVEISIKDKSGNVNFHSFRM